MLIQGDTEAGEKSIDQPKKTVPKAVKKTGRNRWNAKGNAEWFVDKTKGLLRYLGGPLQIASPTRGRKA